MAARSGVSRRCWRRPFFAAVSVPMLTVRNCVETPFISLSKYRKLMGISEDMYPEFKKLNKWVIKDPVDEINRVTDFQVTAESKRESRKVAAIKFKTQRVQHPPGLETRTLPLFPDLED